MPKAPQNPAPVESSPAMLVHDELVFEVSPQDSAALTALVDVLRPKLLAPVSDLIDAEPSLPDHRGSPPDPGTVTIWKDQQVGSLVRDLHASISGAWPEYTCGRCDNAEARVESPTYRRNRTSVRIAIGGYSLDDLPSGRFAHPKPLPKGG